MSESVSRGVGKRVVGWVEDVGLFVILIATLVAAGQEIWHMVSTGVVRLADLLLMFIYLEVVAMVQAYWNSGQLPVRMPLYIGIVALARYLILDMKDMSEWRIIAIAAAVLLLSMTVLVVRYGHVRFPYGPDKQR